MTLVADTGVPDGVYDEVRRHVSAQEVVELTMAIITINGWNRVAVSTRRERHCHYHSRCAANQ